MGKKKAGGGVDRLTTWRVTSPDKVALERLATMYGGTVAPWIDGGNNTGQFEVTLESNEVYIQLWQRAEQNGYMHWDHSKKLYDRQCDGQTCWLISRGADSKRNRTESHCLCASGAFTKEEDGCKLMTRLQFVIAGLPSLGAWTLEVSGRNAYEELPLSVESLIRTFGVGCNAVLRTAKRKGTDAEGKPAVFMVPEVDVREDIAGAVKALGGVNLVELPGVRMQVIDAGAFPSSAPQLPPSSEPEDVEDDEDLNADPETGERIETPSGAAGPITGEVVDTPKGFDLTPEASAFLETCQISPKIEDEFLREVEKLCGAKGYTLSEYLVLCVGKYKTKTLIKAFAQDIKPKGTPEA